MNAEEAGISAGIILLAVIVGLVAGVTVAGFVYLNIVGGGDSTTAYIMKDGPGAYRLTVPNQSSGMVHTTLIQGIDPGVCYRLIANLGAHPLNLTLTATPTLTRYCQG